MQIDFADGTSMSEDFDFTNGGGCCGGIRLLDAPDSTRIAMPSAPIDGGPD